LQRTMTTDGAKETELRAGDTGEDCGESWAACWRAGGTANEVRPPFPAQTLPANKPMAKAPEIHRRVACMGEPII